MISARYVILFFICVLFSSKIISKGAEEYLKAGDDFYKKFDIQNAAGNYEKAYKIEPDNYNAMLKLAKIYNDIGEDFYEKRNKEESERYIRKAVEIAELFKEKYPDSADAYAYIAMSYGNLALYEGGKEKVKLAKKIEENAKKSIEIDSTRYLPYIILGIYYRQISNLSWVERLFADTFYGDVPEGSYEQSLGMFRKVLQISPGMITATFQIALVYRDMDNEEMEKKFLKKVLTLPVHDFRDKYSIKKSEIRLEELKG
ncbi:MAG: tetratricopeptide repeat protein [Ignavibacteria bacterium]